MFELQGQDVFNLPKVTCWKNLVLTSGDSPGEGRANARHFCQALARIRLYAVCHWLTAVGCSAVGERFPCHRDKLPGIAGGIEGQLQHTMRGGVAHLAGGADGAKTIKPCAACPDDKSSQSPGDRRSGGIHLLKSLVIMFMTIDHKLCSGIVECLPKRLIS